MPRCEYCGRVFKTVQGLRRHEATQHPQARDEIKLVNRREMKAYVDARITELGARLAKLGERLEELEGEVEGIGEDIQNLADALASLRGVVSKLQFFDMMHQALGEVFRTKSRVRVRREQG